MNKPLADRIRPTELDDVVGQRHLLEKGKALRSLIDSGDIPNLKPRLLLLSQVKQTEACAD